ncbi:SAM-dependent methyltransferase [Actinoplanes sp. NPDC089786]|uniref:SAM-dependent methyltransferase n=1 Tax=Actinoplanes sp. NPDC089786 TaxID=3155185 RepID=UPI00342DC919
MPTRTVPVTAGRAVARDAAPRVTAGEAYDAMAADGWPERWPVTVTASRLPSMAGGISVPPASSVSRSVEILWSRRSEGREWTAMESFDSTRPTAARAYDYLLGGDNNYESDRAMIRQALTFIPDLAVQARANRDFMQRAVRHLAGAGIRQFLDIGSGIPTAGNVHEVAQAADPEARVVYVDLDPAAVDHGRRLLAGNPRTAVIQEDARNAEAIIDHPDTRGLLDLDEPIAVLMVALLHVIPDADDPYGLVASLRDVMAPGSHLVIAHGTGDGRREDAERLVEISRQTPTTMTLRDRAGVLRFFDGFELVEPGLVWAPEWRPDVPPVDPPRSSNWAGVGKRL